MNLNIVGIYKHDFRDCPEELRELRAGDSLYMEAALQEEGEEDDKEEEHIEGYREANAPVGATERPEGYSEEPFDCYE